MRIIIYNEIRLQTHVLTYVLRIFLYFMAIEHTIQSTPLAKQFIVPPMI